MLTEPIPRSKKLKYLPPQRLDKPEPGAPALHFVVGAFQLDAQGWPTGESDASEQKPCSCNGGTNALAACPWPNLATTCCTCLQSACIIVIGRHHVHHVQSRSMKPASLVNL